ncbi:MULTISPECIES: macrolide family glycosyltransferase [Streptomyces]|uniref:Macrolide family glycosyltransferase n=1 Tax=Streptomyces lienomycini TaxID=284035 RepID=A0ABV9X6M0_9ACTN|nr:macrolide family glycosyltransferase [Streptomyces sp. NBC_00334]
MSRHFLFFGIADHGHVLPYLALVEELVARGHRVTYVTSDDLADTVTGAGATAVRYESRYDKVDSFEIANHQDASLMPILLLEESISMMRATAEHLGDEIPDAIAYDIASFHAGRILGRKWNRPTVELNPFYASNENFSYLHAMMEFDDEADAAAVPPDMTPWLDRTGALLAENGIDEHPGQFAMAIHGFNLVHIPQAFQFSGETFDDRFKFVGPCLGSRHFLGEWKRPEDGLPLVLISLGTVFNKNPEFFKAAVEAFHGRPWHVVITVGDGIDPAELGELPANVEVHRWVPHLDVLEHAAVFVTHGGMGSVQEALYWGRPMVVIPQSRDQRPTARNISDRKLGVTLRPADVTAESLYRAVAETAEDTTLRGNAAEMREQVRQAGGTKRAADEVLAHVDSHR